MASTNRISSRACSGLRELKRFSGNRGAERMVEAKFSSWSARVQSWLDAGNSELKLPIEP